MELTILLVGGTKRDKSMPSRATEEREAKRRTSEANSDISGIGKDKNTSKETEDKMEQMMKRMEQTMQHAVVNQMCHMSAMIDANWKG